MDGLIFIVKLFLFIDITIALLVIGFFIVLFTIVGITEVRSFISKIILLFATPTEIAFGFYIIFWLYNKVF